MVGITETVLRDGHQSLIATRMRTRDMLPAAERLDAIGYRSLEVWGGATFDVSLRFLREDPWERLRLLKRAMPRTPLQMLLRGQNLVGYRHYPDDVVEKFVAESARQGIDIFRVFDALNDPRNMEVALGAVKKAGARAQGTICYTQSPVHTLEAFVELGRRLAAMGADELCVKDMAGFLPPTEGAALVRALIREVGLPVVVHTHSSSGMATMTCLAVAEAGAAAIDSALSPFSGGASQPPTETLVGAMRHTELDPRLDLNALADLAAHFATVMDRYRPLLNIRSLQTDPGILTHQVPGGMLSNLLSQLQEQEALSRLAEVLAEVPRVRADLGYPPLVTPTSQIVGIQAVLNVLTGGRYRQITAEVHDYVRGLYGTPPAPIDPELRKKVLASGPPAITGRPADLLPPEFQKMLGEVRALVPAADDAEALSYALFPAVYRSYRTAIDRGLNSDVLTTAALGVVAALRAPASPPPVAQAASSSDGGGSPWAHEGRSRLQSQRRWVDANHHRTGR
ncbi:MAG: pyruvate carboxylase subunit B [Thermoplasmata archaeon]